MKKNLIYIILSILLLISISINIYLLVKKESKNNTEYNFYKCSLIEKEDGYENKKTSIIKYDNIGRAIFENIEYREKFNNDEEYKMVKEARMNVKENNYEYIDNEHSIVDRYEIDHSINDKNIEKFSWVKYIIDEYKKNDYTCKKITNEE